ncbi:RES family NAD+ phosphorylase [Asticcacaulis sp. AND118]|uniref:RES family NAD+ phosphorylase n=1 Tax=Asticcacaulis sp. AND118 TaxID=2840468 RepID=UPI001CFFE311|nr:RES family NAD+ phosphorylase [Asticcacaulis sp. AND118]UDF04076.1 RES family NAD+ phosphorylase [Asticcacaulis sp. AND118]
MTDDDVDELAAKRVCFKCIGEDYISEEIRSSGGWRKCSFCQKTRQTFDLGDLAGRVAMAFDHHYRRTSPDPNHYERMLASDREASFDFERHGDPVVFAIGDLLISEPEIAEDVQRILAEDNADIEASKRGEETPFESCTYYARKRADSWEWDQAWAVFVESLKTEARFFNGAASQILEDVFSNLDELHANEDEAILVAAGPGTKVPHLFRARAFLKPEAMYEALKRPDLSIGPPPASVASAGRMNPFGISVFYGATDWPVALAEVRPPVGCRVVTARFEITRPLTLLDLSAFELVDPPGSFFDPAYLGRLEKAAFLREIGAKLTVPVMPGDEPSDYLPTQAVAEFLASRAEPSVDGIIFPSVQSAEVGENVVLFRKSCRVAPMDLPPDTEIETFSNKTWDEEPAALLVREFAPIPDSFPGDDEPSPYAIYLAAGPYEDDESFDGREPALRVVPDEVDVHKIEGVKIGSSANRVTRYRMEVMPGVSWRGFTK